MTVLSELITFSVACGFFGLALAVSIATALYMKRQGTTSPVHLWMLQCATFLAIYLLMVVDWNQGFIQRTHDGRELPWFRSAGMVLIFASQSIIVSGCAHLSQGAGSIVWLLGLFAGLATAGTDLISFDDSWYLWALAVLLVIAQTIFVMVKSQSSDIGTTVAFLSTAILQGFYLLNQLLSWGMLGTYAPDPDREVAEYAHLVGAAVWVIMSGINTFLYVQTPASMKKKCT